MLVVETIESALAQISPDPIAILLVNDGCPHAQTAAVISAYLRAHPGRIHAITKPNGGLSDARNAGIEHALAAWPALQAIYFLDADNRIRPRLIARAMAALAPRHGQKRDWVYPDIDMFGLAWAGDFGGPFSLLIETAMNACEAGSLIHRRVFDAGLRFDTRMKFGFEDWDFFLSAARAGFRGVNGRDLGFRYRKRPESMLANSHRDEAAIRGYMLQKHGWLRQPKDLLAAEQAEAPRHAIHLADEGGYRLTSDPALQTERVPAAAFERGLWAAQAAPGRAHRPAHIVSATRAALSVLEQAGLLRWAFWWLERAAMTAPIAAIQLAASKDVSLRISALKPDAAHPPAVHLAIIGPDCLDAVLRDPLTIWLDGAVRADSDPVPSVLRVEVPADLALPGPGAALHALVAELHRLRASPFAAAAGQRWGWREPGVVERPRSHEILRRHFDGAPALARCGTGRRVGFLLPLVAFGGVEKVAICLAREMRAAGWSPELIVTESETALLSPEIRSVFDAVGFADDPDQRAWDGQAEYLGTDLLPWARHGAQGGMAGLLAGLDVVVNCHGAAAHGLMGRLKRDGIRTVAALHLADHTRWGRHVGHPYLGLAYEHAYDVVATCSHQLARWCHAMGMPAEKLVPVPNAPGYPLEPAAVAAVMAARAERAAASAPRRLNALYLGRLDRQKGLDDLADIVARSGAEVSWRIIGRPVIDAGARLPDAIATVLEPPVFDPDALTALYASADVLLLPSAFEGLPLTILEAMRLGVVPIASDVGAVGEAVSHGATGYLFPKDDTFRGAALATLRRLAAEPEHLAALSTAAHRAMAERSWSVAAAPLLARLEGLVAPEARATTAKARVNVPATSPARAPDMQNRKAPSP